MGRDRKQLQKKKAQKAAKKKSKKAQQKNHGTLRVTLRNIAGREAFQSPVYQCWEPAQLFRSNLGMGSVIVTRKTPRHEILMAVFLIDAFCLGVKDAHIKLMYEEEYRARLRHIRTHERLEKVSPACARKLVEGTEEYAQALGFAPHKDYQAAKRIFGDIEKEECARTFEFGRDGKPLYIAGPHDSKAFQKRVLKTLTETLGPEGFHFVAPIGVPDKLFE